MRIVFRCDASLDIGTGHVMRCLTLASELRRAGAECRFICRAHAGHLGDRIRASGHDLMLLPAPAGPPPAGPPDHAGWVGVDWCRDADETIAALAGHKPDWLIVDHYGLDARWHGALRPHVGQIMVIDDLADRELDCDVLLDQNLGRDATHYAGLIPEKAKTLFGPRYVLLRPEFTALRDSSRARARAFPPRMILVGMGGIDADNNVSDILQALAAIHLPDRARVRVVISAQAPHLEKLRALVVTLPFATDLCVDAPNMAELMRDADLAISASGLIIYELACMGVPVLLLPVSDIQRKMGQQIALHIRAVVLDDWQSDPVRRIGAGLQSWMDAGLMARYSSTTLDGLGSLRVTEFLRKASNV